MNRDGTSSSNDPTAERTTDQSAQSAGHLTAGRTRPGLRPHQDGDEELVNRSMPNETPRRYEQPVEDDDG